MVNPYSSSTPRGPVNQKRLLAYGLIGALTLAVLVCHLVVVFEPQTQALIKELDTAWPLRMITKVLAWVV